MTFNRMDFERRRITGADFAEKFAACIKAACPGLSATLIEDLMVSVGVDPITARMYAAQKHDVPTEGVIADFITVLNLAATIVESHKKVPTRP